MMGKMYLHIEKNAQLQQSINQVQSTFYRGYEFSFDLFCVQNKFSARFIKKIWYIFA